MTTIGRQRADVNRRPDAGAPGPLVVRPPARARPEPGPGTESLAPADGLSAPAAALSRTRRARNARVAGLRAVPVPA